MASLISESSGRRLWKVITAVFIIAAFIYLVYYFLNIIVMLTVSVLLSLIFNPLVTFLEKRGLNRGVSILLIIIGAGTILFSVFSYFSPKISEQISQLNASTSQTEIKSFLNDLDNSITRYVPFIRRGTISSRIENFITRFLVNSVDGIMEYLSGLVSVITILVIVPFMTFFILKDNKTIIKGFLNLIPNRYFEMSYWIAGKITYQLGRFVRGWILDAFLVGLLSGIGLSMLGINNAILIGIIAGVGHLIPYFGPIIGGIPAIIISLLQFGDFSMAPRIIFMFLMVYAVDNGFIQPNVFSKSVDMHPLLIIVLMTVGSQLLGVLGLLLAVPLATVIRTAAKEIYYGFKNYSIIRTKA